MYRYANSSNLINPSEYVKEVADATNVYNGLIDEIYEVMTRASSSLERINKNIADVLSRHSVPTQYDTLQDPEAYEGFNAIAQRAADACYEAWGEYTEYAMEYLNMSHDLKSLSTYLRNAINLIGSYGDRHLPEE